VPDKEVFMKTQLEAVTLLVIGLILATSGAAVAGQAAELESRLKKDPDNVALLLEMGRLRHNLAFLQNDIKAAEAADKLLTRLLAIDPYNAAGMVYLGSVKTLKASSAQDRPWQALEYLQEGFALMDRAVQIAPGHPEVRFLRAVNCVNVPETFGRLSVALEDFEVLAELVKKNPAGLDPGMLCSSHSFHGLALLKIGAVAEAEKAFRLAIETDPQSSFAAGARSQLSSLEKKK
jgi:tetratricopeptide (TPR) repeat protein